MFVILILMKRVWFFVVFLFYFIFVSSSLAQHACNQICSGAANITCNETTGVLTYNRGSCNSGLACYSGAGNVCRNPYCPTDTDCVCPNFTIQGYKQPNQSPFSEQSVYLDGSSQTTAQPYYFTNVSANTIHRVSISSPAGSSVGYTLCYNNINCHSNTPVSGNSVYICSNNPGTTNYADLWWHFKPLIPNCKNIKANNYNLPFTSLTGDTITLTAEYENFNGPVTSVGMVANPQGSCSFSPLNSTQSGGDGTYSFNWTPTTPGTYEVFCRAWNDAIAECRGRCVDGPPRYQCPGTDGNGTSSYGTITVQNPGPWYKLKDASLNKIGDHNISVVQNVDPFDFDDNNTRAVIIASSGSNGGVLLSTGSYNPGPNYNPIPDKVAPFTHSSNWHIGSYGSIYQPMLDNFYQYLKSRKQIEEKSNISSIDKNGIYFIKTNGLTISNQPPSYNFVLIVRNSNDTDFGSVAININNFNIPNNKSIMILAKDITFSSSVTTASGIFIATNQFSYQSNNGLKILGNLISKNAVSLISKSNNTSPSLFIVFKSQMYLDLLPYLSISKYDWQQLQ